MKAVEKHVNKFVVVWALALTAFLVMGLTIPNTFTAGTTISSAEMNANFAAVKSAVDALETQNASRGTAVGWATISSAGLVSNSWMANGNTPTVTHVGGSGDYFITWPGEPVNVFERGVYITILNGTGQVSQMSALGVLQVRTSDSAGTSADRAINVIIFND